MTGAAGALGSDLIRRFADEGANVVDMSPGGDTEVDALKKFAGSSVMVTTYHRDRPQ